MNPLIKKFAEQADEYAHNATGSPENRTNGKSYNQNYEEKFAELIVRECAGIYDAIDNGNKQEGTDDYLEALRRRFGTGK